jgi:hypothetical protein
MRNLRVPNHATILDANLIVALVNLAHFVDTFVQGLLGSEEVQTRYSAFQASFITNAPEHSGISLHGLLHGQSDLCGGLRAVALPDLVKVLDRGETGVLVDLLVRFAGL